ncbi:MAG TPA: DUF2911 domain-containing protein [Chryseosolibacter sp.]|nr:DUF2911 domain-containing protein [Chryseosolibacter sp.]
MKKITLLVLTLMAAFTFVEVSAQNKPLSPKETIAETVGGAKTTIVYCRPSARGRKMIGGNEPYGKVWRTGANEATTIEFDKAVRIEGKELPAGKYALFTIPNENEWTIIFNKTNNQWGAYNYDESQDALRVNVKPSKTKEFVETLTIKPEKDKISLMWENTQVDFKVKA